MNYPHKFQIYYILIFYAKLKLNVMLFLVLRMNVEMMPLIHHLEYVMSYVLICDMYGQTSFGLSLFVISMKSNKYV